MINIFFIFFKTYFLESIESKYKNEQPISITAHPVGDEDLKLLINAGLVFLQQLPEIEQKKQDALIKSKHLDKEIQLDKFLFTEKADKNDKKYSLIIMSIIFIVIFVFKKFDIVGAEKLDMVFLLLVSFIFANAGKIWNTFSKNNEEKNKL